MPPTVALISPACPTVSGADRELAVGHRALQIRRATTSRFVFAQELALRIEQAGVQLHRLAGLQHHLGRLHLHPGWRALAGLQSVCVTGFHGSAVRLLRTDGVERVARNEIDAAARDRGAATIGSGIFCD